MSYPNSNNAARDLLKKGAARLPAQQQADARARYRTPDGIVAYVRERIGANPKPYQERVLRNFVQYHRESARAPHGAGKTAIAAWIVIWGMDVFDEVKIPTTASVLRQLSKYLWPEIRKWSSRTNWLSSPRPRILDLALKSPTSEAFAVSSDDPQLIEGAHAKVIIYIFDEAKAIDAGTWDAAEGAFSNAGDDTESDAYAFAGSTPGDTSGRFYDIHTHRPGYQDWNTDHITLEECIQAGQISRQWAEHRAEQWGEESSVYQNRVLGEFATQSEDSIIPLAWVERANLLWEQLGGRGDGETSHGLDVARSGVDQTCYARQVGRVLEQLTYHRIADTMETAGLAASRISRDALIGVDVIGIGAGVVDRLREQGYKGVVGINAGAAAVDYGGRPLTDKSGEVEFLNVRAAMWWWYREALDPKSEDPLALPPDDRLTGDLTAPRFKYTSSGKLQVESKDEIRKRLGRSTDAADAAIQAHFVTANRRPRQQFGVVLIGHDGTMWPPNWDDPEYYNGYKVIESSPDGNRQIITLQDDNSPDWRRLT